MIIFIYIITLIEGFFKRNFSFLVGSVEQSCKKTAEKDGKYHGAERNGDGIGGVFYVPRSRKIYGYYIHERVAASHDNGSRKSGEAVCSRFTQKLSIGSVSSRAGEGTGENKREYFRGNSDFFKKSV